jgi:cytochrome c553
MRAPTGNLFLQELPQVFRSHAVVAALAAAIAAGAPRAPSVAQPAPPPAPLMPIALEGNVERGAVLAQTCKGCHGIPNYFNATPAYEVPRLGGQNADYVEVALQGYRRGTRGHETMQAQASSLTDQDIADIAAYFADAKSEAKRGRNTASTAQIEAGRTKSMTCVACHGPEGIAAAPQWPNLAGQHQGYLLESLLQYKDGTRVDVVMNPLIAPLDDATIEELAAFFATQAHLHDTPIGE